MNLTEVRKGMNIIFTKEPSLKGLKGQVLRIGATKHYGPKRCVRVRIYDGEASWMEYTDPVCFELDKSH
jgi:hypothetical protein